MQVKEVGYLTDMLGSRAVDVVNGYAKSGRPFMISLHFNAPHWSWEASGDEAESNRLRSVCSLFHYDGATQKTYQRLVQAMDLQIGRVLEALRENGFIGKYDRRLYQRQRWRAVLGYVALHRPKTELLEGGLRIPAIISWPARIPQGRTTDQVAITMDWLPTLRAAAGVSFDPAFLPDGIDLLPHLTHDAPVVSRRLFWRYKANAQRVARDGDF